MRERLLSLICCPKCKSELRTEATTLAEDEITEGAVVCSKCRARYPITNGIPRFVSKEELTSHSNENFELYWHKLDWHKPKFNKKRFYELTGWTPQDIQGKLVLEAGCGGGRWLYQFADDDAGEIVAFDFTSSVDKAKSVCATFNSKIHYLQADIFNLPFKEGVFDIVHCHGVLMTTPDPEQGVENLAKLVKPGGELAVLLYRNLTKFQKKLDDFVCYPSKHLPTKLAFYLSLIPSAVEYVPGAVPLFENFIHLSGQPSFTLKHLHNFDWYTCVYRHRNSPKQVSDWFSRCGFEDIKILNTNDFRTNSKFQKIQRLKEHLLEKGCFLKATLGVRATKSITSI